MFEISELKILDKNKKYSYSRLKQLFEIYLWKTEKQVQKQAPP